MMLCKFPKSNRPHHIIGHMIKLIPSAALYYCRISDVVPVNSVAEAIELATRCQVSVILNKFRNQG